MLKRFITICLLITAAFTASADVFTVTSNADAGAGTLRQALTLAAANGSTVKDYIYFNITDQSLAGRTIVLLSLLPEISSNLVIDGTTQPGTKFGISDAKITIMPLATNNIENCFVSTAAADSNPIEIYGLFIKGFDWYSACAIKISAPTKLVLGAPGKGNILSGNTVALRGDFSNCKIQSNIMGLDADGITPMHNVTVLLTTNAPALLIGGDTPQEGNIISGNGNAIGIGSSNSNSSVTFKNNFFGTDYTGTKIIDGFNAGSFITATGHPTTVIIEKNVFSAQEAGLVITDATAIVKGNYFGTDKTETYPLGHNNNYALDISGFASVTVGGLTDDEQNIFTNYRMSISSFGIASKCEVIKNRFYCNDYIFYQGGYEQVVTNITNLTNSHAEGSAPPGSKVQLYHTETKCAGCNPNNWFATVITNSNGHWEYNGSINSKIIISSTIGNSTTGFAPAYLKPAEVKVIDVDCHHQGSIELVENRTGRLTIVWKNETGVVIGNGQKIDNLPPGTYYVEISEDGECPVSMGTFYILEHYNIAFPLSIRLNCGATTAVINAGYSSYAGVASFSWQDSAGNFLPNVNSLILPAGEYYLTFTDLNGCTSNKAKYEILPALAGPSINQSSYTRLPSSCTVANGSIHGVTATGTNVRYSWKNEQNVEVGTSADLDNQPAGKYTLTVTDDSNCGPITSSPIEILSANDIAINTTTKNIQDAKCNNANGAITNIQVTGTGTYLWVNEQGVDVGHNKDLAGVPAGKYKLTVSSANCPPVSTDFIEILEVDGITIDDTQKTISMATCQYNNGGISNIQVTGATKYTWYNASNVAVSNNLDLTGMPTGTYYLIAANNTGCSKQTIVYTITRQAPISYGGLTKKLKDATCDENNGSIEVIFQNPPPVLPGSYKWVNTTTGQVVNTSTPILTGIDAGAYDIYGITNGCEQYLIRYFIARIPKPVIGTNNVHVTDDHCSAGMGSIKGIQAGGLAPITYTWTDDNGINQGTASPDLLYAKAGTYHLKITDGANCEQDLVYTIYDQSDNIAPPTVNDVQLCSPGSALLSVSNADSKYGYRLYEDNNSAAPIDEQQNGSFKVNIKANRSYYISQYLGNCESQRSEIKVILGSITEGIANTFTPNGDGINDYWKITGMENYTNGTVKVFNRDGKMVYQSKGYAVPFDGTLNGKPLPAGVYYYIIDLKSCNLISGNLTILR